MFLRGIEIEEYIFLALVLAGGPQTQLFGEIVVQRMGHEQDAGFAKTGHPSRIDPAGAGGVAVPLAFAFRSEQARRFIVPFFGGAKSKTLVGIGFDGKNTIRSAMQRGLKIDQLGPIFSTCIPNFDVPFFFQCRLGTS